MSDKIIGRFEPIGDDKGPKRAAFDVLTKEKWMHGEGLSIQQLGFQGINSAGFRYSVIAEHWRWAPTVEFEIVDGPVEPADGGPAFGHISVRDYFAAKALQAIVSNEDALQRIGRESLAEHLSRDVMLSTAAYSLADAMLQERAK